MRIIFIRHGQTASNTKFQLDTGFPGAPLDETGLAQAEVLADTLKDEPIEWIMSSDFTRARQTAEPLARAKGIPVVTHPGIREIYAGEWELDTDWTRYVGVIEKWKTDLTASMPGGDSGVSFFTRYDAAIKELADEADESGVECAAVVTHGAAMQVWLPASTHAAIPEDQQWALHNTDTVVIEGEPRNWRMLSWAGRAIG